VLFLSALTLCGCEYFAGASAGMIIPPPVKAYSFEGKWEASEDSVQFAEDAVVFGGQLWEDPSYRVKRVEAKAYLATKNFTGPGTVNAVSPVDVITMYSAGNYLGEFMKIDESNMIFFVQNNMLLLKKVSDQADSGLREAYAEARGPGSNSRENLSGVLIGLKSKTRYGDYTYRTLWIAASPERIRSVLEVDNIFFPRMSGFWECVTQEDHDGEFRGNILVAQSAFTKSSDIQKVEKTDADEDSLLQPAQIIINYIGNDYVSVEYISGGVNRLNVLPVDSLSSPANIKAAYLLGKNDLTSYENARMVAVSMLENKGVSVIAEEDDVGENFGLAREKGHWKLVGRVGYYDDAAYDYLDFDLKIIPPNNLVFFDTLSLNWNRIKDRVPDALDAFTSPDKNIALVKTKNKIAVYAIGTEQLSENSRGEIELAEGETIVMAEWATAMYVDNWERSIIAYGAGSGRL
jgi:hypothetical protein